MFKHQQPHSPTTPQKEEVDDNHDSRTYEITTNFRNPTNKTGGNIRHRNALAKLGPGDDNISAKM